MDDRLHIQDIALYVNGSHGVKDVSSKSLSLLGYIYLLICALNHMSTIWLVTVIHQT
jgi:hypothetical protein